MLEEYELWNRFQIKKFRWKVPFLREEILFQNYIEYDTCNINIDNDNVIQKKEISNIIEERYGKNHSRMKKI